MGAMTRTDAELLIASRDDPRAFRELYDRWADRLLAYFYRRVLDAEVAGDLLAETFAVAFEKRRRFRDVGAPGAAWLYGIANKELAHWFRRQAVERKAIRRLGLEVPPLDDESIARIEALADMETYRSALTAALEQMSAGERDAVELRVVAELGYAEIASRLDCTEAAARVRVHRGLARLNRLMEVAS
jgi:RNA polymerase sigma-70 factor, ECF subfamily